MVTLNKRMLRALVGFILVAPTLVAQTTGATPAPIPEEARKHFVMGETIFKEAKSPANFSQATTEFTEAAKLAPQWPEARYNLALAKEAAGDYSGAMDDLKLYQQFKLTDAEARTVQDKIYAIEAKQKMVVDEANSPAAQLEKFFKSLDGGVWREVSVHFHNFHNGWDGEAQGGRFIKIHGREINEYQAARGDPDGQHVEDIVKTAFNDREFETRTGDAERVRIAISGDGQSIVVEQWASPQPSMYWKGTYQRIK